MSNTGPIPPFDSKADYAVWRDRHRADTDRERALWLEHLRTSPTRGPEKEYRTGDDLAWDAVADAECEDEDNLTGDEGRWGFGERL